MEVQSNSSGYLNCYSPDEKFLSGNGIDLFIPSYLWYDLKGGSGACRLL